MSRNDIIPSSGNVFGDLGLPNPEESSIKARLVLNLKAVMKLHNLTQKEVAKRCKTDQPTISKVLKGRLDLVTVERLLSWLACLNQDISITIRDRFSREESGSGSICVYSS